MAANRAGSTLDKPVLTRKERDLLKLLENNPGRCYSRSYLLKTIWGYSDDTRTRTVDVHVSRLRKKLRKDAQPQRHLDPHDRATGVCAATQRSVF